ncbi:MAG: hypothetical protein COB90_09860 [Hyphomicrobiales bacterium]|nr:MAG: hypothetical protein COB90_09860 [Hyphomicrobiales bacterium]
MCEPRRAIEYSVEFHKKPIQLLVIPDKFQNFKNNIGHFSTPDRSKLLIRFGISTFNSAGPKNNKHFKSETAFQQYTAKYLFLSKNTDQLKIEL